MVIPVAAVLINLPEPKVADAADAADAVFWGQLALCPK